MQINVNFGIETMEITLEYAGETYSEQWYEEDNGVLRTKGKAITSQIEDADISDEFGDDFLDAIELLDFCEVWEKYRENN